MSTRNASLIARIALDRSSAPVLGATTLRSVTITATGWICLYRRPEVYLALLAMDAQRWIGGAL